MMKIEQTQVEAMVTNVVDTISKKWGLDVDWDIDGTILNVSVCYVAEEVEVFNDDIAEMSSEKEILDSVEGGMMTAFNKFDLDDAKARHSWDLDIYDDLEDDNKEYKKIFYLLYRQREGVRWAQIQLESFYLDKRTQLGELIAKETNPGVQALYVRDLANILDAPVLYMFMKSDADPRQFIKAMQSNPRINLLCELGKLKEAEKEILALL